MAKKCVFICHNEKENLHAFKFHFGLNMFLLPQVSVNFGISPFSKLYTNLVIYI